MRKWLERRAYLLSQKLLAWSGDAGSNEWARINERLEYFHEQYYLRSVELQEQRKLVREAMRTMLTVDGLLSAKEYQRAQEQLRVQIIGLRR